MLSYRQVGGSTLTDSIVRVTTDTMVTLRVLRSIGGTAIRQERVFVRTSNGVELAETIGNRLLYPLPWPTVRQWSFNLAGSLYRFVILKDTTWVAPSRGARRAWVIQQTIETPTRNRLVKLVVVDGLGVTNQRSLSSAEPDDFDLVEIIPPRVVAVTPAPRPQPSNPSAPERPRPVPDPPRPPPKPINLKPLLPAPYVGLHVTGGTHGTDKPPEGAKFRDEIYFGGTVEAGLHHFIGVRGRMSIVVPYDSGRSQRTMKFRSADVFVSTRRSKERAAILLGVGYSQFQKDTSTSWHERPSKPNSAFLGVRGVDAGHRTWALDVTYYRRVIQKPLMPELPGAFSMGDLVLASIGIRFF